MSEMEELKNRLASLEAALGKGEKSDATQIVASEFVLVDEDGNTRAKLHLEKGQGHTAQEGPRFTMYRADGAKLIEIEIDERPPSDIPGSEPSIVLYDGEGNSRLRLSSTKRDARIGFSSGENTSEMELSSTNGSSKIELAPLFRTSQGFPVRIASSSAGAGLEIFDKMRTGGDGTVGPGVYYSRFEISHVQKDETTDTRIVISTPDDEILFSAPTDEKRK